MDLLRLIRSLEELLYEVMTWLVLYPTTLWNVVRDPLALSRRADVEMTDGVDDQFIDMVSPPLFLMLSIFLAHGLELALHATLGQFSSGLAKIIFSSQQNLLIYRCLTFGLYPIIMAAGLLRRQGLRVDRESLRRPFFLQCYFAAPFALLSGCSSLFLQSATGALNIVGAIVFLSAFVWYGAVQTAWFRTQLHVGRGAACWIAVRLIALGFIIDIIAALIVLVPTVWKQPA